MDKVLEYKEKISAKLERYEKIVELEKQTGVDKFYIFCVGALLAGILLFVVGGEELVVGLVGFIYPAYMSFKAINTPGTGDDTSGSPTGSSTPSSTSPSPSRTSCSWIPFYFFFKIAFLVWSYHPSTQVRRCLQLPFIASQLMITGEVFATEHHGSNGILLFLSIRVLLSSTTR